MGIGPNTCIHVFLFGMTGRVRLMTHFPQGTDTFSAVSQAGAMVTDTEGRHAQIASIERGGAEGYVVIRLDEGREVALPISLLEMQNDGSYRFPFAFDRLSTMFGSMQPIVIKVLQEELQVGKRVVDTGKGVRVHKAVTERQEKVDVPLMHDELQIDRVAVGQIVNTPDLPVTRYEGDTLVVPIIEEVLVVQKQFLLKEEVRITKRKREEHTPQTVVLKSEQVTIERFDEQSSSGRNNIPDSSI